MLKHTGLFKKAALHSRHLKVTNRTKEKEAKYVQSSQ